MNPKFFRITVWTSAITSILALILYLPTLIWSPPWNEDGYYLTPKINDESMIIRFDELGFSTYQFEDGYMLTLEDGGDQFAIVGFNDDELVVSIRHQNIDNYYNIKKLKNPFTILRIKWQEWTAE